jgi:predicted ABC-type ATPase
MTKEYAHIIAVAGPNGAGKSTTAPSLLKGALKVSEFVNADMIAQELSPSNPEMSAIKAGRIMLKRMHHLADNHVNFAFESTMASRSFAPWIAGLRKTSYFFHMVFLWLPSQEFAINRVAERVRMGGHNVPETTIKRRYRTGLQNFFKLYQPLADTWYFYDNSGKEPKLVAYGERLSESFVKDEKIWHNIKVTYEQKEKI